VTEDESQVVEPDEDEQEEFPPAVVDPSELPLEKPRKADGNDRDADFLPPLDDDPSADEADAGDDA
jgi:hypothetical protein